MPISAVTICNIALSKLGASRITSLLDKSEEAILCNLYYEITRDEVLRSHPWACAIERQSLAQLSSGPITDDYDYQYQLPTDPYCLRPLNIPNDPSAEYKIEGRKLLTNLDSVILRYIKRVVDPNELDPLLVKTIAYRLAADISYDITNSRTIHDDMVILYKQQLEVAKTVSSLEGENLEEENTDWIDAGR